jgi:gliding motility-associated-like protein
MDGSVNFWSSSTGNINAWQWNYGDTTYGYNPYTNHSYQNIGTYLVTLVVTDSNGCKDTTSDTVKVLDIFTFYVPNAFTPNGDGWNDYFAPKGKNIDPTKFNEYIYDRWGNLIFHTNKWNIIKDDEGQAEGWNGTLNNKGNVKNVIMDVYVYRILVTELGGSEHEYIGSITLIP